MAGLAVSCRPGGGHHDRAARGSYVHPDHADYSAGFRRIHHADHTDLQHGFFRDGLWDAALWAGFGPFRPEAGVDDWAGIVRCWLRPLRHRLEL